MLVTALLKIIYFRPYKIPEVTRGMIDVFVVIKIPDKKKQYNMMMHVVAPLGF